MNGNSPPKVFSDEWQIMQALQEKKMKMREDLERQMERAKQKVQKQWVLEQLREKKLYMGDRERRRSIYDYEQSWDKDMDIQSRNYSQL